MDELLLSDEEKNINDKDEIGNIQRKGIER